MPEGVASASSPRLPTGGPCSRRAAARCSHHRPCGVLDLFGCLRRGEAVATPPTTPHQNALASLPGRGDDSFARKQEGWLGRIHSRGLPRQTKRAEAPGINALLGRGSIFLTPMPGLMKTGVIEMKQVPQAQTSWRERELGQGQRRRTAESGARVAVCRGVRSFLDARPLAPTIPAIQK